MTGKELILYILNNNLENENIFDENGIFIGLMSIEETAAKFDVGVYTIETWEYMGWIKGVTIGDKLYFPVNIADPRKEILDEGSKRR